MRHVYVAIPTRSGMVPIEAQHCYVDIAAGCHAVGAKQTWATIRFGPYIQHARNRFVAEFLANPAHTDLLFIDDDITWEEGAVERLLSHDADVVAGVYPMKKDRLTFPAEPVPGARLENGLLEMAYVPAGFLRIKRIVLEAMIIKYSDLLYLENSCGGGDKVQHGLFWVDMCPGKDGRNVMVGEDVSFCFKWRAMGGKVYADPSIRFKHYGAKDWEACYGDHLSASSICSAA